MTLDFVDRVSCDVKCVNSDMYFLPSTICCEDAQGRPALEEQILDMYGIPEVQSKRQLTDDGGTTNRRSP